MIISTLADAASIEIEPPLCEPNDIADILFTSGSTGRPKAVVLGQSAILAAARQITSVIGQTHKDTELVMPPLGHSFGLGRVRSMALAGNSIVLEPNLRDPAGALLRLLQLKVSGLSQVPAGFEMMRSIGKDRLAAAAPHLRYIEIGSAPISRSTRLWLTRLLPRTRIYHHYGMTEASRAVFSEYHRDDGRPDSIGFAAPGVQVVIADADGAPLPCGTEGEITIRGAMLMNGYLGEAPHPPGVAFRSGDRGHYDADGYLYLSGRSKDIINVGGLKVMPAEVEKEVETLVASGVLDVMDFAVVGGPDPAGVTGEVVAFAYTGPREISSAALRGLLLPRLASYKVPTLVARLERVPRTPSGKILRAELGDLVARKLADGA